MAALPEAYSYDRVYNGMLNPDYEALAAALPAREQGPIVDDMHKLGDAILQVSEAMPKVGIQGVFGYIYGSLTHVLADVADGRTPDSRLPGIDNFDDLTRQAGHFAATWTNPAWHLIDYHRALKVGDKPAARAAYSQIGPHWRYSWEAPEVQFSPPVIQFTSGGMIDHILGSDLRGSLVRSEVSDDYMRPGGDYDNVNEYIRYITMHKATELMTGNDALVKLAVRPVPAAIAGLRWAAKRGYRQLKRVGDGPQADALLARADADALRLCELTTERGFRSLRLFSRMARIDPWSSESRALGPDLPK